ncbi:hypothetical protein KCP75_05825 [Salmonella enterica subsp. enterica]|nr:hypothetical protein KCP75_05825 [Salmonella enterica subsp. enterica]
MSVGYHQLIPAPRRRKFLVSCQDEYPVRAVFAYASAIRYSLRPLCGKRSITAY